MAIQTDVLVNIVAQFIQKGSLDKQLALVEQQAKRSSAALSKMGSEDIEYLRTKLDAVRDSVIGVNTNIKTVGDTTTTVRTTMSKIGDTIKPTVEVLEDMRREYAKNEAAVKLIEAEMNKYRTIINETRRETTRFRFEYLGLMFAGMALARSQQRWLTQAIEDYRKLYGEFDPLILQIDRATESQSKLRAEQLKSVKWMFDFNVWLSEVMAKSPKALQDFIANSRVLALIIGKGLMVLGQLVLAMASLNLVTKGAIAAYAKLIASKLVHIAVSIKEAFATRLVSRSLAEDTGVRSVSTGAIIASTGATIKNTLSKIANLAATKASTVAHLAAAAAIAAYTAITTAATGAVNALTGAVAALNAIMAANPIFLVITALAGLIILLMRVRQWLQNVEKGTEKFSKFWYIIAQTIRAVLWPLEMFVYLLEKLGQMLGLIKREKIKIPIVVEGITVIGKTIGKSLSKEKSRVEKGARDVAVTVSDYLASGSPPKRGPLHKMDQWGKNYDRMVAEGMISKRHEVAYGATVVSNTIADEVSRGISWIDLLKSIFSVPFDIAKIATSFAEELFSEKTATMLREKFGEILDLLIKDAERLGAIGIVFAESIATSVSGTIKSISDALQSMIPTVSSSISLLVSAITDNLGKIQASVTDNIITLSSTITDGLVRIIDIVSTSMTGMVTTFGSNISLLSTTITNGIASIASEGAKQATIIATVLGGQLASFIGIIGPRISQLASTLASGLSSIVAATSTGITNIVASLAKGITGITNMVATATMTIINTIVTGTTRIILAGASVLTNFVTRVGESVTTLTTTIISGITQIIVAITGGVASIVSAGARGLTNIITAFTGGIAGVATAIASGLISIANSGSTAISKVLTKIPEYVDDTISTINNSIRNIASGFGDMLRNLGMAATGGRITISGWVNVAGLDSLRTGIMSSILQAQHAIQEELWLVKASQGYDIWGAAGAIVSAIKNISGMQTGGYIPSTGLYMLHAGEYVVPRKERSIGSTNIINVTVNLSTQVSSQMDIDVVAKKVGDLIARDIERRVGVF